MAKKRSLSQAAAAPASSGQALTRALLGAVMNGPATVMITDLDGAILYVNQTFCSATGYALADVFGQQVSMLSAGPVSDPANQELWERLRRGEEWVGELHGRRKNGECYWEQASICPIRDESGRLRHLLKISEDITQRKLLENELRSAVETLRANEASLQATCRQLAAATRALKKSQRKLQRLSQQDALTGLLNRRGFKSELQRVKALAEREGQCIGFLIIDIDHFKQINDLYGHAIGDHILKTVAELLRAHLRASDLICRYGGDEVIIALPSTDEAATRLTANRILQAVRHHDFSKGHAKLAVTVSIGAACKSPLHNHSVEKVIKLSDHALYCIKKKGRDGMAFWSADAEQADVPEAQGESKYSQPFRFVFHILVTLLEAREQVTGEHCKRVAQMAALLARAMNLAPAQVEIVEQSALLHDIGKIAIPDAILTKPGPLTPEERKIVQRHPKTGADILRATPEFKAISEVILSHQEWYDGSGYPRRLKGKQICIGARIFAVVNAYEAMRAGRPYARPRPPREALREITRWSGKQFDPDAVGALARCQAELEAVLKGRSAGAGPGAKGGAATPPPARAEPRATCSRDKARRGRAPSARTRRS